MLMSVASFTSVREGNAKVKRNSYACWFKSHHLACEQKSVGWELGTFKVSLTLVLQNRSFQLHCSQYPLLPTRQSHVKGHESSVHRKSQINGRCLKCSTKLELVVMADLVPPSGFGSDPKGNNHTRELSPFKKSAKVNAALCPSITPL